MKKLYKGKVTLEVFTIVDHCEDSTAERNNAHGPLDFELFNELKTLVEAKGYHAQWVGADLHYVAAATENQINLINSCTKEAKSKESVLRGETTVTRIQF